jgi:hypothetical protein
VAGSRERSNHHRYRDGMQRSFLGGGNSFGIVTRFDFSTYSSSSISAGIIEVAETEEDIFLNAVACMDLLIRRPP